MSSGASGRFRVEFRGASLMGGLYRVGAPLSDADGGMAAVYAATNTNLGAPVVVKVPDAALLARRGFRERFDLEVEFLKRFDHPHVVRILAAGEHDDVPFLVLAYLGGGSLRQRLRQSGGRQSAEEVLGWLRPIAATLDFLHYRGVVHRDVKPGNILFHEVGTAYLSDFGIAKVLEGSPSHTATGLRLYTPAYAAPEQMIDDVGGAGVDGRADQYALAVTVYEALAGAPPYAGSQSQIEAAKLRDPVPPLAGRAAHLPPGATAAVERALCRDPAGRHATCSAFVDAFEAGLAPASGSGGTSRGRTRTSGEPARVARARPRRWPWGVGAAAVAVLGFLAWRALPGEREATPTAPTLAFVDEPAEGALLASRTVVVRGRVSGPLAQVVVNDRAVGVVAGRFETTLLVPAEGPFAIQVAGSSAPFRRNVTVDTLAPGLEIDEPRAAVTQVETSEAWIRGRAVDPHLVDVRVSGRRVEVGADGRFQIPVGVPADGSVEVEVEATDRAGHAAHASRTWTREASWRGLLRQAQTAFQRTDVAAAAGLLDLATAAGAPAKDVPADLASGVAAWKADPVLVLLEPADGTEVAEPSVRVRGTLNTGRAADRVLVNDVAAILRDGAFDANVDLAAEGRHAIRVRVLDGPTGASRAAAPPRWVTYRIPGPEAVLARSLGAPDANVREEAAHALADYGTQDPAVIRALVHAQGDADRRVAEAAFEALESLQPGPVLARRQELPPVYRDEPGQHVLEPARNEWQRQDCGVEGVASGEAQGECWALAVIPPIYGQGRVVVEPNRALWHTTDDREPAAGTAPFSLAGREGVHPQAKSPSGPHRMPPWGEPGPAWCVVSLPARTLETPGREAVALPARWEWRDNWT